MPWNTDGRNQRATDTEAEGTYKAEVELTYSDGGVETVPNAGYMELKIEPDLG